MILVIFNRFPKIRQIAPVYALIVFVVYSWTFLWFFWRLSGWLYSLSLGEILVVLAFSLVTNFLESLVVLAVPVFLAVVLPQKWFYDAFVARGVASVIPGLGYVMYIAFQFQTKQDYPGIAINWYPAILGLTLLLVYVVGKVGFLRKVIEIFADRATIFLYFSIPASLFSILVVLIGLLLRGFA